MSTWDCFTFFNELDMLEVRLRELDGVVDRHVLVEAPVTFRGDSKPLWYEENRSRFARWSDRIVHLVAEPPETDDPWVREAAQRNAAFAAVADAAPDDLVLVSDVDEIPRAAAVERAHSATRTGPVILSMRLFYFTLHWTSLQAWLKPKAVQRGDLGAGPAGDLDRLRNKVDMPAMPEAGWHFSHFSGPEALVTKIKSYSHAENDTPEIASARHLALCMEAGISIDGRECYEWTDEEFPPHVRELLGD